MQTTVCCMLKIALCTCDIIFSHALLDILVLLQTVMHIFDLLKLVLKQGGLKMYMIVHSRDFAKQVL